MTHQDVPGNPPVKFEFFFDCTSPWSYLAFVNVQPIAARLGVPIIWRPVVIGGVFNKANHTFYETRANPPVPRKRAYGLKDIQDWARMTGIVMHMPPKCGHPVSSVKCMRACLALLPRGKMVEFAAAAFHTFWTRELDISKDEVLVSICEEVAVDPSWLMAEIAQPHIKQGLMDAADELVERGAFGSPTMYINNTDMYFGNDRLPLVEHALSSLLENPTAARVST